MDPNFFRGRCGQSKEVFSTFPMFLHKNHNLHSQVSGFGVLNAGQISTAKCGSLGIYELCSDSRISRLSSCTVLGVDFRHAVKII